MDKLSQSVPPAVGTATESLPLLNEKNHIETYMKEVSKDQMLGVHIRYTLEGGGIRKNSVAL